MCVCVRVCVGLCVNDQGKCRDPFLSSSYVSFSISFCLILQTILLPLYQRLLILHTQVASGSLISVLCFSNCTALSPILSFSLSCISCPPSLELLYRYSSCTATLDVHLISLAFLIVFFLAGDA